jgi:hypothetical protein
MGSTNEIGSFTLVEWRQRAALRTRLRTPRGSRRSKVRLQRRRSTPFTNIKFRGSMTSIHLCYLAAIRRALASLLHHFPDRRRSPLQSFTLESGAGAYKMREHHGRASDAAVLLRRSHERLTSQLLELDNLRAHVLEAERRAQLPAEFNPPRPRKRLSRKPPSAARVCAAA